MSKKKKIEFNLNLIIFYHWILTNCKVNLPNNIDIYIYAHKKAQSRHNSTSGNLTQSTSSLSFLALIIEGINKWRLFTNTLQKDVKDTHTKHCVCHSCPLELTIFSWGSKLSPQRVQDMAPRDMMCRLQMACLALILTTLFARSEDAPKQVYK